MSEKINRSRKIVSFIAFIIYIGVLLYFLFFSDSFGRTEMFTDYRYNLKPFSEIRRFMVALGNGHVLSFVINILGNIIVFIPFGFLVPKMFFGSGGDRESGIGYAGTLIISVCFVLEIELLQLFTKVGVFDVDDIIMNTLGASIGYFFHVLSEKMVFRAYNRKMMESGNEGR